MTTPNTEELLAQMKDLVSRVKLLEDEVFGPPGSPTVAAQLAKLGSELEQLDKRSAAESKELHEEIREAIRITAELREIVANSLQKPRPG
jgi:transposase